MSNKECLVVPRNNLIETGLIPSECKEGYLYTRFSGLSDLRRLVVVANNFGKYAPRYGENNVENDQSLQQLIIYGFVMRPDGRLLLYQRGIEGSYDESRLARKFSLGVGGHMEPGDISLARSFYRELEEEISVLVNSMPIDFLDTNGRVDFRLMRRYLRFSPRGLIKDERDDVGRVHLGVACRIVPRLESTDIQIKTESGENIEYRYVTPEEYINMRDSKDIIPEGWTDIVFSEEILPDYLSKRMTI